MPNRLAGESSPYLLQHADNPVDWYPWGPEALERARALNRPILLSIGYSSCHWCHVMERESFEDPGVAEVMNRSFVSVKVDREERPDIDQVYMRAVQAMTGQGGWPLTVFLTPGGEPYYGGTYFPPTPRQGMPSFRQVLDATARAWHDQPEGVRRGAAELLAALRKAQEPAGDGQVATAPGVELLDRAVRLMARQYDPGHGGFGGAPKFPQPVTLEVLLRQHARTGEQEPLDMALTTLRRMAAGGIRDHLAGGFHRYAVDARWMVPHFEKMLYDNVLLARVYLDAYRLTGADDLRGVAEHTLDYVLQDLRDPAGGFRSARDADSEGEEGRYYLWTAGQVLAALPEEEARPFMRCYDVTPGGNFEGKNILWLPHDPAAVARAEGMDVDELGRVLERARATLLELRRERVPPLLDDKVLVGWNGMAIRAFAEAGGALGRSDYVRAAAEGAAFVLDDVRRDGVLLHTWKGGTARIPGFLEDYAALGNALLSLHEATLDLRWLTEARWCCEQVLARFWDEGAGVFHDASDDGERLFMRPRDPMDNATPSGSSLAAELLLRAGHLFGEAAFREAAERVLAREAANMARFPTAFGRLLSAVDRAAAEPVEIAIFGEPGDPATQALLRAALGPFHRSRTVAGRAPEDPGGDGIPVLADRGAVDGKATAYVCRGYACRAPVTAPRALAEEMAEGVAL